MALEKFSPVTAEAPPFPIIYSNRAQSVGLHPVGFTYTKTL